jgi:hypothetical protein
MRTRGVRRSLDVYPLYLLFHARDLKLNPRIYLVAKMLNQRAPRDVNTSAIPTGLVCIPQDTNEFERETNYPSRKNILNVCSRRCNGSALLQLDLCQTAGTTQPAFVIAARRSPIGSGLVRGLLRGNPGGAIRKPWQRNDERM